MLDVVRGMHTVISDLYLHSTSIFLIENYTDFMLFYLVSSFIPKTRWIGRSRCPLTSEPQAFDSPMWVAVEVLVPMRKESKPRRYRYKVRKA